MFLRSPDILLTVQSKRVDHLVHRHAFAGEGGFLNFEAGAFQQSAVGRHAVARFQNHHVAGNQIGGVETDLPAVAQHLAGGGGDGLQGFNGSFRLAFLEYTQNGIQQHDDQNDENLRHALASKHIRDSGHGCSNHQNHKHGILELFQKTLQHRRLFSVLQLVRTILFQSHLCLRRRKSFCLCMEHLEYFLGCLGVGLFHLSAFFHLIWIYPKSRHYHSIQAIRQDSIRFPLSIRQFPQFNA